MQRVRACRTARWERVYRVPRAISLATVLLGVLAAARFGAVDKLQVAAAEPADAGVRFVCQWGSEGSEPGQFQFPMGIAVGPGDEIVVTDHYNNRLQKFDALGTLRGAFEVLPNPGGIAIDERGRIYVSHFPGSSRSDLKTPDRIAVYDEQGRLLYQWGESGIGDGQLSWPGGLAISPAGRVYVADQTNRRVQVFDGEGRFLLKWGEYGTAEGQFGGEINPGSRVGGPQFIALDRAGNVFTTEGWLCRVQQFTADGRFLAAWGGHEDRPGGFGGTSFGAVIRGPIALCFDADGNLWTTAVSGRVQQFTPQGRFLRGFGGHGTEPGQFRAPHGLAIDSAGDLYVVDAYNQRVQKFDVTP